MQTVTTIDELRAAVAAWRRDGERVAFVPTMGNLHAGHLRLVETARRHAERVVASIFVNPLQFGAGEDFAAYPRTLAEDQAKLAAGGCDLLFAPSDAEVYPQGREGVTYVEVPGLSDILCGAFRPGHFRGVATVVCKLFNMVQPEVALFGEKDYQQLLVIRRLAADLNIPVEIVGVPTVREPDGLAMSSRNRHLSPEQRQIAGTIPRLLQSLADDIAAGGDIAEALISGRTALFEAGIERLDYLECADGETLEPVRTKVPGARLFVAAFVGKTRLIDNWPIPS